MKRYGLGLVALGLLVVGLVLSSTGALGAGTTQATAGAGRGTGGGCYAGGMMGGGGQGNSYGGMMGGWNQNTSGGRALTLAQAQQQVQGFIDQFGNPSLKLDEVMEFQCNFYAVVRDTSTGHGAFEVLVNKVTGAVFFEYGPAMMWNTQYSMMGARQARGPMTVSPQQATRIAQQWLSQHQPGVTTEAPDQFPGYYTLHFRKNGRIAGMLSVNGYSGQVWYHTWHGAFIRMKEG